MLRAKRPMLASILAATMIFVSSFSMRAHAEKADPDRPGEIAMITDTLIGRPTLIGATIIGAAIWIVTLPFSVLGGNTGEAGKVLVLAPGESAFLRCLGCTPAQNERTAYERRTKKANKNASND
ncbi:MAG: hypothetical protein P1U67_05760 [Alcanivoracaceae bacterium]|nr:hypothetical protein [Alcanivoracaceae bacterium]